MLNVVEQAYTAVPSRRPTISYRRLSAGRRLGVNLEGERLCGFNPSGGDQTQFGGPGAGLVGNADR